MYIHSIIYVATYRTVHFICKVIIFVKFVRHREFAAFNFEATLHRKSHLCMLERQDRGGYVYQGDKAQLQLNLEKNYKCGSYPLVIVNCKGFDLRFHHTSNKHYEIHDYINDHMMQHMVGFISFY